MTELLMHRLRAVHLLLNLLLLSSYLYGSLSPARSAANKHIITNQFLNSECRLKKTTKTYQNNHLCIF